MMESYLADVKRQYDLDGVCPTCGHEKDAWTAQDFYNEGYYDAVNSICWVSTEDRMPVKEDGQFILVWQKSKTWTGPSLWRQEDILLNNKSLWPYWMPIPKLLVKEVNA